ncbi:MAG TPA: MFS transporter [Terrimesophilobacter sp.]|mgnify:CR=1 FL=1|nr:MFS transporter [Terrimesophilobacter sp.]HRQ00580.1 MFS transporter [Terrimesophilobacter sp.]
MHSNRRLYVMLVFFVFLLLHQVDRYLIGVLTTPIMDAFDINEAQMGAVQTGAVLVGMALFPLWGYLFDRYARPKILALASALWGATTWLSAVAPNYGLFMATRASTGIDDATYPGVYSMVSDLYPPTKRGRVLAVLQTTGPVAFIVATVIGLSMSESFGWRSVFLLTGALGIVMAGVFFFTVRDVPRGLSEPAIGAKAQTLKMKFDRRVALGLLRRPTLLVILLQVFVHLFPIQALLIWSIRYFEVERQFDNPQIYSLAGALVLVGILGFLVAGWLGDRLFQRYLRGRLLLGACGVGLAAITMTSAFLTPTDDIVMFSVLWASASFFYGFSQPTVTPTIQDVTEPEVRSTAHAMVGIAEQAGSALAPLLVGVIAIGSSLGFGLTVVSGIGFGLSCLLLLTASFVVARDVRALRETLAARADADPEP